MKKNILLYAIILVFLLKPGVSPAQEKSWRFLPSYTLFSSLLADPREPQTGFSNRPSQEELVGSVGKTIDLFQWKISKSDYLAWGATGAAFALLDYDGGSFPMKANDWEFGTYLSHSSKRFSQRLEFNHVSTHLGDALSGIRGSIVYSREFFRWITSYDLNRFIRFYGGGGLLVHTIPNGEDPLFFQGGTELFTRPVEFISNPLKLYAAYDLKYKQEAGGVINNSLQIGVQWKPSRKKTRKAVRIAISYFNGNNEFGQFYLEKDSHWGFGIYFDS